MKVEKFTQKNENLIVFFSGFMMDPEIFDFLDRVGHDIFFIYDYRDFDIDNTIFEDVESYFKVDLISFSLGVSIAPHIMKNLSKDFSDSIAINGTLKPIDNYFGIPEKIFQGTLDNLSEENLDRFYKRVFGNNIEKFKKFLSYNVIKAKNELKSIQSFLQVNRLVENIYFKAIISEEDKIFPPSNQMSFWQHEVNVTFIPESHFLFGRFNKWSDILDVGK
jgi:biotin synthesis protein BioG